MEPFVLSTEHMLDVSTCMAERGYRAEGPCQELSWHDYSTIPTAHADLGHPRELWGGIHEELNNLQHLQIFSQPHPQALPRSQEVRLYRRRRPQFTRPSRHR